MVVTANVERYASCSIHPCLVSTTICSPGVCVLAARGTNHKFDEGSPVRDVRVGDARKCIHPGSLRDRIGA
jgi:hypothetical protein